jgi:hypothetical protein
MTMAIEISKTHPLPPKARRPARQRHGDGRQQAILALQPGESFFLKAGLGSAHVLKWWAVAKEPGRSFYAEKEGDGIRIWRSK